MKKFKIDIGIQTIAGNLAAISAVVALGATINKHFTINKRPKR